MLSHGAKDLHFIAVSGHAAVWGGTNRLWKLVQCLPEMLYVPQEGRGQSSPPEVVEEMTKC